MKNIIVVCSGNSCRSQIAHGFLAYYIKKKAAVYSAGLNANGVNPMAIKAMAKVGLDISSHTSNHIDEYNHLNFDYIITVCDDAMKNLPPMQGKAIRLHKNFPDLSKVAGTEQEIETEFDEVRNMINSCCQGFVSEYFTKNKQRKFIDNPYKAEVIG